MRMMKSKQYCRECGAVWAELLWWWRVEGIESKEGRGNELVLVMGKVNVANEMARKVVNDRASLRAAGMGGREEEGQDA